jgi:hypothetical protein
MFVYHTHRYHHHHHHHHHHHTTWLFYSCWKCYRIKQITKFIIHLPFQFSKVYADSANDHLGRMQKESLLKYGRIAVQNGKCMPHSPFCSVVQHLKSGLCHLIVEDSRTHTIRHAVRWDFSVRGISCSPRPLSAQHNKRKRRTSIPSAWLEPAIQAFKRLQTYALDRTVTEIRWHTVTSRKF